MTVNNRIRQIKGGLLFVAFFVVGITLYLQNGIGTIAYMHYMGIEPNFIIAGFFAAAIACGYTGLTLRRWNGLWYTPYTLYVGATWLSVADKLNAPTPVPVSAAIFYTLLLAYLVLDWVLDWRKDGSTKPD